MEKCKQVAVYGTSLNMAVIAASLKADATLRVVSVDFKSPTARQTLDELDLTAVVFDLSDPAQGLNLGLMCDRPNLLLIGVDPSKGEIRVFSSRSAQALSISDLINVIHQKDSRSMSSKEENQELHSSEGVNNEQ